MLRRITMTTTALFALILAIGAQGCSDDSSDPVVEQSPESIAATAAADGRFTTLLTAVEAAGLSETLASEGPYTVFAPTDEAFAALPDGALEALLGDPTALSNVLLSHVVPGKLSAEDVLGSTTVTMASGEEYEVRLEGGMAYLGDAMITATDIEASNGIIHVIDTVLLPSEEEPEPELPTIAEIASADGSFSTLVAALGAANLVDTLSGEGPFTVFAPTDDAFAALPEGTVEALLGDIPALTDILLYHVVSGSYFAEDVLSAGMLTTLQGEDIEFTVMDGQAYVNGAMISVTDIEASNGVIHVIDAVILPPEETELPTIAEIAAADGNFSTLVAALSAANLVDTLNGEGPFTVFAPTDDAFAALPEGTVEALLGDIPALTDILLYHVVSGSYYAEDVLSTSSLVTVQGAGVSFSVMGENAYVNDAMITATDIEASNGVIHVIDAVILPPAM